MVLFLVSNIWSPAAIFHWNICLVLQWRKFKGLSRISRMVEDFKDCRGFQGFSSDHKKIWLQTPEVQQPFSVGTFSCLALTQIQRIVEDINEIKHIRAKDFTIIYTIHSILYRNSIPTSFYENWSNKKYTIEGGARYGKMSMKSIREDLYVHITILTDSYALMHWYFHKTSRTLRKLHFEKTREVKNREKFKR